MLRCVVVAGIVAAIGLSACGDAKEQAAAPPPVPKSGARSVQFYAGQDLIAKVDAGSIAVEPGGLTMQATGATAGPGYVNLGFLPRINAYPPKDGIYEVDVVADKPAAATGAAPTPVEAKGQWSAYPADHLKGVRFIAKDNAVTTMLPAKG